MSQEKVDKYKKDKANRKKIIKKEKRLAFLRTSIITLIVIAFFVYLGYSVVDKAGWLKKSSEEETTVYSLSQKEVDKVWKKVHESTEETSNTEDTTVAEGSENESTSETVEATDNTADNTAEASETSNAADSDEAAETTEASESEETNAEEE